MLSPTLPCPVKIIIIGAVHTIKNTSKKRVKMITSLSWVWHMSVNIL